MRGREVVLAVSLGLAVVLAGCGTGGSRGALGGGEDVDVCRGYEIYDGFAEPDPGDGDDVRRYVDGFLRVLDRIDPETRYTDQEGDRQDVPARVLRDVETMEKAMKGLRERVSSSDSDAVRAAVSGFSSDRSFREADRRLGEFHATKCQ